MGSKSQRFRGVRQRHWGSWVSEIRHPITKIRVWLGTFHSAVEAALAYDEAARFISGVNAKTNFPYNICSTEKLHHCRLSHVLREKLRRCCYMEFSPTRPYQDLSQATHNMNATDDFTVTVTTAKQPPCRNMIDSSRHAIFSSWNDLCESGNSSSEELEEPSVVVSDDESSQSKSNEMSTFSEEQLVACHDTRSTRNDSQIVDDYFVAEMINESLNCSSTFDLEFDLLHLP